MVYLHVPVTSLNSVTPWWVLVHLHRVCFCFLFSPSWFLGQALTIT